MSAAYGSYADGDIAKGNQKLWRTTPWLVTSMLHCGTTAIDLASYEWTAAKFMWRDDWKDVATANYNANKDLVDRDWGFNLKSWEEGTYFNAGMFYAEVWNVLSKVPEPEAVPVPVWF